MPWLGALLLARVLGTLLLREEVPAWAEAEGPWHGSLSWATGQQSPVPPLFPSPWQEEGGTWVRENTPMSAGTAWDKVQCGKGCTREHLLLIN